jgi:hypothetical protein
MRENQQRKLTMQKIAKGGPQRSGVKKPAAPKMVNSNSPAMRQIKAKAAAARARAQGKPGITGPVKLPNSVRAGKNLVKAGAQQMRTIGDSPTVRAAAQQGQRAVEAARRNRARLAAGVGKGLKEAAALKTGLSALRGGAGSAAGTNLLIKGSQMLQGGLERAGFKPPKGSRSQAEINARATPKPATPKPAAPKGPTPAQRTAYQTQETKARRAQAPRSAYGLKDKPTPGTTRASTPSRSTAPARTPSRSTAPARPAASASRPTAAPSRATSSAPKPPAASSASKPPKMPAAQSSFGPVKSGEEYGRMIGAPKAPSSSSAPATKKKSSALSQAEIRKRRVNR